MKFIDFSEFNQNQLITFFSELTFTFKNKKNVCLSPSHLVENITNLLKITQNELEHFIKRKIKADGIEQMIGDIEFNSDVFFNRLLDDIDEQRAAAEFEALRKEFTFLDIKARFDSDFMHPIDYYLNIGYLTLSQLQKHGSCFVCQRFHKNKKVSGSCLADGNNSSGMYRADETQVIFDCHQFKGQPVNIQGVSPLASAARFIPVNVPAG